MDKEKRERRGKVKLVENKCGRILRGKEKRQRKGRAKENKKQGWEEE